MKIKKIKSGLIVGVVLVWGVTHVLFNSLPSFSNEPGFAVSSVFKCVLERDKEVRHLNSYFYNENSFELESAATYYSGFTSDTVKEKIIITGELLKNYENGDLFKLVIKLPELKGYFFNNNLYDDPGYLIEDRVIFYFYVTTDKIYRVSPYVYDAQKNQIYKGLNNELLLIHLLSTDQAIVANSKIVCQNEEMHTIDEYGRIINIALENEKVKYERREYNQSSGELHFHEEFVWERDKGLVSYGSAYRVEAEILYLNAIEQI